MKRIEKIEQLNQELKSTQNDKSPEPTAYVHFEKKDIPKKYQYITQRKNSIMYRNDFLTKLKELLNSDLYEISVDWTTGNKTNISIETNTIYFEVSRSVIETLNFVTNTTELDNITNEEIFYKQMATFREMSYVEILDLVTTYYLEEIETIKDKLDWFHAEIDIEDE